MAVTYVCPQCQRDIGVSRWPPTSLVRACPCGTCVHHNFSSFVNAWWFWFLWAGTVLGAVAAFVLQLIGRPPFKPSGDGPLWDLAAGSVLSGMLAGAAASALGGGLGCALWFRARRRSVGPADVVPAAEPDTRWYGCEVCGFQGELEPSYPRGDANCPRCNTLLWPQQRPCTLGNRAVPGAAADAASEAEPRR